MNGRVLPGIAAALAACLAAPGAGQVRADQPAAEAPADQGCQADVESLLLRAPIGQSRVVVTFTGEQRALLPLWEATSAEAFDSSLIPIDRTLFILTIQVRPSSHNPESVGRFSNQACALAGDNGARFNGVILYRGNDMIEAAMAEAPED